MRFSCAHVVDKMADVVTLQREGGINVFLSRELLQERSFQAIDDEVETSYLCV